MTSIDKATLPFFFRDEKPEEVTSELKMFIGDESEAVLITKGDHGLLVCMSFCVFRISYYLCLYRSLFLYSVVFTGVCFYIQLQIYENEVCLRQHFYIALLNYTDDAIRAQKRRSVKVALPEGLLKWSNFLGRKKENLFLH